jgi:hypothetical protein
MESCMCVLTITGKLLNSLQKWQVLIMNKRQRKKNITPKGKYKNRRLSCKCIDVSDNWNSYAVTANDEVIQLLADIFLSKLEWNGDVNYE